MRRYLHFIAAHVGLAFLATACATTYPLGPPKRGWPPWAEDLTSSLECGMGLAEAEELSGSELFPLGGGAVLGTHMVQRRSEPGSVVLVFEQGRLVSFFMTRPVAGTTSLRTSPRKNLCTGEVTFVLKLGHLFFSGGTKTYLDGRLLRRESWPDGVLVSAGEHELRLETPDRTIARHFDLRPDRDDGVLYVDDPDQLPTSHHR